MKFFPMKFALLMLAGLGLFFVQAEQAFAAPITWGAPQQITGDSDVSTNGTLNRAINFNGPTTTVNGVEFTGAATFGGITFPITAPFNALSADYQDLLGTAFTSVGETQLSVSGLVVGQMYEVQFWSNNSADEFHYGVVLADNAAFDDSVFLSAGDGPVDDYELGQYIIGTFVADSTDQTFWLGPDEIVVFNGFQLRAIEAASTPVPEPSSLAVFGTALLTAAGLRRRRIRTRAHTRA